MKGTLIIMVKEPRPGRVKTRLGRDIGLTASAWWFRHQTRRLLWRLRDPRWDIVLAVSPDREGMQSRVWPQELRRRPQGRGDLGARMARMLWQVSQGPACLIGADIPAITRKEIAQGFAALGNHDAVFGPAPDGGFWLIGLKHPRRQPPHFFKNVRWSSEFALADSIATLPEHRIARIATLRDVDTADDLPMT
ncbi:TIGR04282 family arsenosugar biosynthesis glycosyltransferase [Sulfitobacter geojensis]|uniref:TIGR04282 family arsenosugar biosynthesis glycosyltransferase n=1 Tax=Sulfitobacter geojensis TaxID=1342299 RepID=A0AAE2VYP6_9RHOB|nr:TIGR04282 family arsenosugar biosynthesis glycosyltransferase [Sulfitobacter geojensis]MBM1689607.1 TIGR04282 family arsenosugar biosynthesis glycosyltransferase [Sulfitobacter geojensis]MBM1693673.1 TIGR04282 family arsenosugar biosynthesis glycosyltransferase [Sulfitobacter geojensis]MBM1705839.1 TIGR04282 family arsenosugar biosynthesis glycosyltransferase [Sulfitobacter geojensis]MBM1709897.1 TIGR04282 family arsenosugar biosynthesis glycosyltransferase [Sulfitobacter geojensis]MBM17139